MVFIEFFLEEIIDYSPWFSSNFEKIMYIVLVMVFV